MKTKNTLGRLSFLVMVTVLWCVASASAAPTSRYSGRIEGRAFHYTKYGDPMPVEVEPGVWLFIGIGDVQMPTTTSFTVLASHNHREVARVHTDEAGFFSVTLKPGRYLLLPDDLEVAGFPQPTVIALAPIEIQVKARRVTTKNLFYFSDGPASLFLGVPGGAEFLNGNCAGGGPGNEVNELE